MNVLLIFDTFGWCFETECLGIQKYSKFLCTTKPFLPADLSDLKAFDLIYFSSPSLWNPYSRSERTAKIVVGVASIAESARTYGDVDTYIGVSRELTDILRKRCPKTPVEYIPDGVDPEIFYPYNQKHEGFRVGWAGNFQRKEKRTHILGKLDYEVHIKSDLTYQPNIPRSIMTKFYNEMDVIVLPSSSEGCSLVPLEAGACKTAFVGTRVGTVIDYIPDHWLVKVESEEETIKEMNERLHELENNRGTLEKYKEELYRKVISEYSWKEIVKKHEKIWERLV